MVYCCTCEQTNSDKMYNYTKDKIHKYLQDKTHFDHVVIYNFKDISTMSMYFLQHVH